MVIDGFPPSLAEVKLPLVCTTMPKRQAIVIFPEVNYKLSLVVMENVKRESLR
jgi:hypothetical protein